MTRTELIDLLEAAEGPSRELDEEIFIQITPGVLEAGRIDRGSAADLPGRVGWWPRDTAYQSTRAVPHYTASIDAALSFTPEGWKPSLLSWAVPELSEPNERVRAFMTLVTGDHKGHVRGDNGATPAIALCIANFRALEAQEEA